MKVLGLRPLGSLRAVHSNSYVVSGNPMAHH